MSMVRAYLFSMDFSEAVCEQASRKPYMVPYSPSPLLPVQVMVKSNGNITTADHSLS